MLLLRLLLVASFFLVMSTHLMAQDTDIVFLKSQVLEAAEPKTENDPPSGASLKRISLSPVHLSFLFYRKVVSEQISADCAFDLSCSRFSSKAIKSYGLVKGVLLTADRLTRCHTFISADTAPILFNNKTGRVIDEPAMY